jgi:hypothetical protein
MHQQKVMPGFVIPYADLAASRMLLLSGLAVVRWFVPFPPMSCCDLSWQGEACDAARSCLAPGLPQETLMLWASSQNMTIGLGQWREKQLTCQAAEFGRKSPMRWSRMVRARECFRAAATGIRAMPMRERA